MDHNIQPLAADTSAALLRSLRDVMARHGVQRLRARDGATGMLELAQNGTARPASLHLSWAQEDDRLRLRQAAALSEAAVQETERDELTFYSDLLMALLRSGARRVEFSAGSQLAFVPNAQEAGGIAFVGEGLVFTPR